MYRTCRQECEIEIKTSAKGVCVSATNSTLVFLLHTSVLSLSGVCSVNPQVDSKIDDCDISLLRVSIAICSHFSSIYLPEFYILLIYNTVFLQHDTS